MDIREIVTKIKPEKRCISDKYSWNLYRMFVEAEKSLCFEGRPVVNVSFRVMYKGDYKAEKGISMCDTFYMRVTTCGEQVFAYNFGSVMRKNATSKLDTGHYLISMSELTDITEWFFKEYLRSGRCVFDRKHCGWWTGDRNRFRQINRNSRKCNWCGEHQRRGIKKFVKVERREVWTS